MADLPAPPRDARLVFRWPERIPSFLLPGVFLLAVAGHAVAFYLFQVVYPPIVSIAPPTAQVTLLTASSPENRALLQWVEAQNPEAAPRLQAAQPPGLEPLGYTPSYAAVRTLPKPFAVPTGLEPYPAATASAAAPPEAALPEARPAVGSRVRFSGALASRAAGVAPHAPLPGAAVALPPSVFLAAVDDRGAVRYLFLQQSSGNPTLDRQAEAWLRDRPFQREENAAPLAWGFATVGWGAAEVNEP